MGNEVRMEKLFPTCGFSIPAPLNLLGNRVENGGRIFLWGGEWCKPSQPTP